MSGVRRFNPDQSIVTHGRESFDHSTESLDLAHELEKMAIERKYPMALSSHPTRRPATASDSQNTQTIHMVGQSPAPQRRASNMGLNSAFNNVQREQALESNRKIDSVLRELKLDTKLMDFIPGMLNNQVDIIVAPNPELFSKKSRKEDAMSVVVGEVIGRMLKLGKVIYPNGINVHIVNGEKFTNIMADESIASFKSKLATMVSDPKADTSQALRNVADSSLQAEDAEYGDEPTTRNRHIILFTPRVPKYNDQPDDHIVKTINDIKKDYKNISITIYAATKEKRIYNEINEKLGRDVQVFHNPETVRSQHKLPSKPKWTDHLNAFSMLSGVSPKDVYDKIKVENPRSLSKWIPRLFPAGKKPATARA